MQVSEQNNKKKVRRKQLRTDWQGQKVSNPRHAVLETVHPPYFIYNNSIPDKLKNLSVFLFLEKKIVTVTKKRKKE